MSVREQCRLLGVPRSTLYYEPCGPKASDLAVMRRLDEQYTATPFYGVERMTACLRRGGLRIGHSRGRLCYILWRGLLVLEQYVHVRSSARSPAAFFAARTIVLRKDDPMDSAAKAALTGGDFSKI